MRTKCLFFFLSLNYHPEKCELKSRRNYDIADFVLRNLRLFIRSSSKLRDVRLFVDFFFFFKNGERVIPGNKIEKSREVKLASEDQLSTALKKKMFVANHVCSTLRKLVTKIS